MSLTVEEAAEEMARSFYRIACAMRSVVPVRWEYLRADWKTDYRELARSTLDSAMRISGPWQGDEHA